MNFNNPFETYTRGMTARERRIRTKWGLMFALTGIIAIALTFVVRSQKEDIKELNSQIEVLSNERDEFHDANFISNSINLRYELTFDYLKEVNPNAHKQAQDFYDHQTE